MKLTFLGTASCFPTPTRGVSCTALHLDSGQIWLFDCGEGSQIQMQKSNVKAGKVNKIFITHLHGDHLFGLPGLLCTLGNGLDPVKAKSVTVTLYGPVGLRRFVTTSLGLSRSPLVYQLRVVEMEPRQDMYPEDWHQWDVPQEDDHRLPCEVSYSKVECKDGSWQLFSEGGVSVVAAALVHRIPSFGFVITEAASPGQLDSGKLLAVGIKPGPIYGKLKAGQVVEFEGKVMKPEDFVGPDIPGRQVGIMGDTSDSSEIIPLCSSLDMLVHEATMEDELKEKAVEYGHSTPSMAAQMAIEAGAKKLILFHLSPRYKPIGNDEKDGDVTAQIILDEAVKYMANKNANIDVVVAQDFTEVEIPRKVLRNNKKS